METVISIILGAVGRVVRWFWRPIQIPFDPQLWPAWVAQETKGAQGTRMVINYEVTDYEAKGYDQVRYGLLRREVRAGQKVGYAVLMVKR